MNLKTFLIFVITVVATVAFTFRISQQPPKSYTVTLTLDQWKGVLGAIDSAQKVMVDSDIPVRKVVGINQALAQVSQTFSMQLSAELQKEAEAQKKKDSS